jgi:tRNA pseudouridine(38-40) synthase
MIRNNMAAMFRLVRPLSRAVLVLILISSIEVSAYSFPRSAGSHHCPRRTPILHEPTLFLFSTNPISQASAYRRRRRHHHHHRHHPPLAAGGSTSASQFSTAKESDADAASGVVVGGGSGTAAAPPLLTSVLLHIAYDGSNFNGWSAANDDHNHSRKKSRSTNSNNNTAINDNDKAPTTAASPHGATSGRRRRNKNRFIHGTKPSSGVVRSVQGVLQRNLAKIYGKVQPLDRIVVEGCSRTDKGVHARFMVAQIYCLTEQAAAAAAVAAIAVNNNNKENDCCGNGDAVSSDESPSPSLSFLPTSSSLLSIPGKRRPHPRNCTDTSCFMPVPKQQQQQQIITSPATTTTRNNLSDLGFTLNRMLPPDIRIMRIAPTPTVPSAAVLPFHPTLSCTCKTYRYQFSLGGGPAQDPTQRRFTLQLKQSSSSSSSSSNDDGLFLARMQQAAECLQGRHNFAAFSGAPRGTEDRRKRRRHDINPDATVCHIFKIDIEPVSSQSSNRAWNTTPRKPMPMAETTTTYRIAIRGDRFLYKMARFLVGAIISAGLGKVNVADLEQALILGKVRRGPQDKPFYCAPPDFLVLHDVQYNVPIDLQSVSN